VGKIRQVPPTYSAIRYKGTRAYKLARRGESVELKTREVTIYSLRILSVDLPRFTMRIKCSSGTYIRSLAADLGKNLGPGGYLQSLRRLRSGPFKVEDALPSSEIADKARERLLSKRVLNIRDALPDMEEIAVDAILAEKIRHGYQPAWEELIVGPKRNTGVLQNLHDKWIKLVSGNKLVAIMKTNSENEVGHGKAKIERVFSVPCKG